MRVSCLPSRESFQGRLTRAEWQLWVENGHKLSSKLDREGWGHVGRCGGAALGWILLIVYFVVIGHMLSTPQMRRESRERIRPYGWVFGAVALIVPTLWIGWPPVTNLIVRAITALLLVCAAALLWKARRGKSDGASPPFPKIAFVHKGQKWGST